MKQDNTKDNGLLLVPDQDQPEAQASTALQFTGPLTRDTLSEYSESQTIRNAKKIVPRIFRALAKGIDMGDRKSLELGMQAYGLIGKSGITIINNLLQQNNNGGANGSGGGHDQTPYFENILRAIERQEQKSKVVDIDPEDE